MQPKGSEMSLWAQRPDNYRGLGASLRHSLPVRHRIRPRARQFMLPEPRSGVNGKSACPWCGNVESQGHEPSCEREAALASAPTNLVVMEKERLEMLERIVSERPSVGEWSHSLGVWCFQGKQFGSGSDADYAAFSAHLTWSKKLVQALAALKEVKT